MDMRLIREEIGMEQPLGTASAQAVVEGEVTLPGGLREQARVLAVHAMACAERAEALQDRINLSGRTVFHVLYTQGDPTKVSAVEAAADFSQLLELPGVQPRADVTAQAQVEKAEAHVNGGRLAMRATVKVDCRAVITAPVEAIMGVDGVDEVEVRTQEAALRRTVARGSGETLLREEFELPEELEIVETLFATAQPVTAEATGGMGSIGMSGQIRLDAVHASALPGRPVVTTSHMIPFSHSVEADGAEGEELEGTVVIRDVAVASQDMGDGERTLRAEVLLGMTAWAERTETMNLMADAYTTAGDDVRFTGRDVPCRTGSRRTVSAESARVTLLLPDSAPPVRQVLAAFVTPRITAREQAGSRLNVEGVLGATLVYMSDDAAPVSVRQEEPFRAAFAAQAGPESMVMLEATDVEARPVTSDRVELRCVLRLTADEMQRGTLRLLTDAQTVAAPEPVEDIVLYFTQPGETLWDIARRYRLPVQDVRALNPELTTEPAPGQGIVIWRRSKAAGS